MLHYFSLFHLFISIASIRAFFVWQKKEKPTPSHRRKILRQPRGPPRYKTNLRRSLFFWLSISIGGPTKWQQPNKKRNHIFGKKKKNRTRTERFQRRVRWRPLNEPFISSTKHPSPHTHPHTQKWTYHLHHIITALRSSLLPWRKPSQILSIGLKLFLNFSLYISISFPFLVLQRWCPFALIFESNSSLSVLPFFPPSSRPPKKLCVHCFLLIRRK